MKAARLHGPRDIRLDDVPCPVPAEGQVLVRVRAVGLCGSDLHYYTDGRIGDTVMSEPLILGHEFAGTIAELGPGVRGLEVGQLVAVDPAIPCGHCEFCEQGNPNVCPTVRFCGTPPTDGALCEYIAWPAHLVFQLPARIDAVEGALLEALGVALHAVDLGKVRLASRVAVLGQGPIGLLVARLAKASGAVEVYVSEVNPTRLAASATFGADVVIDARAEDPVARVKALTGGRGVDVVFETAGSLVTPQQAVDMVKPGGTVVIVGINPDDRIPLKHTAARRKGVTIRMCRRMKHVYRRCIDLVTHDLVDPMPLVSGRYPLAGTGDAFALLARLDPAAIKLIVEP
jgi:L-iditol 2-dehydrogenase